MSINRQRITPAGTPFASLVATGLVALVISVAPPLLGLTVTQLVICRNATEGAVNANTLGRGCPCKTEEVRQQQDCRHGAEFHQNCWKYHWLLQKRLESLSAPMHARRSQFLEYAATLQHLLLCKLIQVYRNSDDRARQTHHLLA